MKHTIMGILAACMAVALAGCGGDPQSVAIRVTRGIPDSLVLTDDPGNQDAWEPEALAGWIEEGETFGVVSWGSSSCVPIATKIEADGDDHLTVRFADSPHAVCTADLAATTHEFTVPTGITGRPITLTVTGIGVRTADDGTVSNPTFTLD